MPAFDSRRGDYTGGVSERGERGPTAARGSAATPAAADSLYFFPDRPVSEAELRQILSTGTAGERAWAISHLLRYAQWDDIWTYITRDEVREIFGDLDLPENLRVAWGRMLKVEAPVA
jgi:hypothetical protein